MGHEDIRLDHQVVSAWVPPGSTVLDLGCGNGNLLYVLIKQKGVRGHGLEINEQDIYTCVAKGLNVLHGDIEKGLSDYKDRSFDYVILNQSLQQIRSIDAVIKDALRVGKKVVVGFPNFAYYRSRVQIFFGGRTPVNESLPYKWYETPNLHFFSVSDFFEYCRIRKIRIEDKVFLNEKRQVYVFPNIFAQTGLFLMSSKTCG
ncbi:MAG: methionine biosynthesis protein MetW [Candidatus Omnitrophota bacterium]